MNVLGRRAVARIVVVDIGVAEALPPELPIVHRKVALGTANLALGPGQTPAQTVRAIGVGFEVIDAEWARGLNVVCLGETGIGNTTAASAIVAAITDWRWPA